MASVTTHSRLNLRAQPLLGADILLVLPAQHAVDVLGNQGVWLQVRYAQQTGYVHSSYTSAASAAAPLWRSSVTALAVNLRSAPDLNSPVRAVLRQGTALDVVGQRGLWLEVQTARGSGFVYAELTASVAEPAPVEGTLAELLAQPTLSAAAIHRARTLIMELPPEQFGAAFEELQTKPVYRSQRDNAARDLQTGAKIEDRSGSMCNLTSLAMCLDYLGVSNPRPAMQFEDTLEIIRQELHLPPRTDSRGWGGVAQQFGVEVRIIAGEGRYGAEWFDGHVRPLLRNGYAVMMSISGHIVRVQAVTAAGLVVDDPYGQCTLKPGGERQWEYQRLNAYGEAGQLVGDNSLWRWSEVAPHVMRWVARLGFASPQGKGDDDGTIEPQPLWPMIPASTPDFSVVDAGVVGPADQPE